MTLRKPIRKFTFLLIAGLVLVATQQRTILTADNSTLPPTNTPHSSPTTLASDTHAAPNTRTPIPSRTLLPTRTPTDTRTPTATRTPSFTPTPPPTMVIMGTYQTPINTPVTMIPPAAASPATNGDDIVTVLLLGSDTITHNAASRTDVIIIVAINRTTGTVSMIHLPRDLFVYVPNDTMEKINTVMNLGNVKNGVGGGVKLLRDTIQYNFGLKINFYAHIEFVEFQKIIAQLGGLDIGVDCGIQDNKLKAPNLDPSVADNYELYTLPVGFHHLDPYTALWYVRSRYGTSDLDRGTRQMDVLKAMWHEARDAGLLSQVAQLWPQAQDLVETDMTLSDVLGLVPMATSLDPNKIQQIAVQLGTDVKTWYTSDTGQYALLPQPDQWHKLMTNLLLPPPTTRLNGETPTIEIGAALPLKGYDRTAADRLTWDGFAVTAIGDKGVNNRDATVIYDYTGGAKPASLKTLTKALRVDNSAVIEKPDPNRTVDFRVEMGKNYGNCLYTLPVVGDATPTAAGK